MTDGEVLGIRVHWRKIHDKTHSSNSNTDILNNVHSFNNLGELYGRTEK